MKLKARHLRADKKGFTLIELMVSLVVLTLLAIFAGQLYINYTNTSRDLKAANLVYEEARFLMERIVREVRQNAIDYEEYFNQNVMTPYNLATFGIIDNYGDNYCAYSNFFYDNLGESIGRRNEDFEDAVVLAGIDPAAVRSVEHELYLINIGGDERTMLIRVEEDVLGNTTGKVAMVKMVGKDFGEDGVDSQASSNGITPPGHNGLCAPDNRENDGLIDTWHCDPDFPCRLDEPIVSGTIPGCDGLTHLVVDDPTDPDYSFIDISPNAINVLDLKFLIAPEDDPWKAYNMNNVQMQPHVTIQLTVEANPVLVDTSYLKNLPSVTLTSTVTARNYDEINSDCE